MVAKRCLVFFAVLVFGFVASAADDALVLVDRQAADDRNLLLEAGIPLVLEHNTNFLALGEEQALCSDLDRLGYQHAVIDHPDGASRYAVASIVGERNTDFSACGEVIAGGDGWNLLKAASFDVSGCRSPRFMLSVLSMRVLKMTLPPPERYQELQNGDRQPVVIDPLIQDMVTNLTDDVAMAHWQAILDSAPTRYSDAQGCIDAADDVYNLFDGYGLAPAYHYYSAWFLVDKNVVGTLTGLVDPDEVVVVIGHLDSITNDDPMTLAPGADDNASGSAMVTSVAEAMLCYDFEKTVKFLTVTGEEQGLYGSSAWADDANSAGMNIVAVLNGDMIAWEGNDDPEDLDVHTNNASVWLGNLMAQQSSTYDTGVPVNAFLCPEMRSSDHAPFWDEGWSAICGITDSNSGVWWDCPGAGAGFNPYYHSNDDTIANSGAGAPAFLGGNARTYLATAADIAVPIAAKTSTPTDLTAQGSGDNSITLSWATSGSGLEHEVYRAPGGCSNPGPATLLATVGTTLFTDTTAAGQMTYGYWLRSIAGHCGSAPTACIEAATTGACTESPVFGGLETVTNQASATCGLELSWSAVTALYCGSTATYTIYRSLDPAFNPGPANRIADNISGTTHLDTDALVSGEQYYYIVRAVDTSNDVEDNNLVRISGKPTGPSTLGTWTDNAGDSGDAQLTMQSPWSIRTDSTHSSPNAYGTGTYSNNICVALTTPAIHLNTGSVLGFWSSYEIETNYDKGIVEISTDNGTTWEKVPVNYPDSVSNTGDACVLPTGAYFANGNRVPWAYYSALLDDWADEDVLIRWRLSTDYGATEPGWWVDDIEITNVGVPGDCTSVVETDIFLDGFETGNTSGWSTAFP